MLDGCYISFLTAQNILSGCLRKHNTVSGLKMFHKAMFNFFHTGKYNFPHHFLHYLLVLGYTSILCQPLGGRHWAGSHHIWHSNVSHLHLLERQASVVNQDFW
jgi:hypothetical protein